MTGVVEHSMDGDIPNVPDYVELKRRYDCLLMIDEAHSFGTIGATGGGIREQFGLSGAEVDLWMGTLSKSLASMGGWIAGSRTLVDYLRYTTPGFVYAAGLAPPLGAAAVAAFDILISEPWRPQMLQRNAARMKRELQALGIDTGISTKRSVCFS